MRAQSLCHDDADGDSRASSGGGENVWVHRMAHSGIVRDTLG